jgi:hypothetical protein
MENGIIKPDITKNISTPDHPKEPRIFVMDVAGRKPGLPLLR